MTCTVSACSHCFLAPAEAFGCHEWVYNLGGGGATQSMNVGKAYAYIPPGIFHALIVFGIVLNANEMCMQSKIFYLYSI